MKKIIIILLLALTVTNCSANQFSKDLKKAFNNRTSNEQIEALLRLRTKYKKSPVLESNIGGLYISLDYKKAFKHLLLAKKYLKSNSSQIAYVVFGNLAYLYRVSDQNENAFKYAQLALKAFPQDPQGVNYTLASIYFAVGKGDQSFKLYQSLFKTKPKLAKAYNYFEYVSLLISHKQFKLAEKYHKILMNVNPRLVNQFSTLGQIQLQLKKYDQASFNFFIEYLLAKELRQDIARLSLQRANKATRGGKLSQLWKAWNAGKYRQALKLASVDLKTIPFVTYILADSYYHTKQYNKALDNLKNYLNSFKNLSESYYLAWNLFKAIDKKTYNFKNVRKYLERCINLKPESKGAYKSRIEIGRLIGINKSKARHILTGKELDRIYAQIEGEGNFKSLDKVFNLLSIKDNVYSVVALWMLNKVKTHRSVLLKKVALVKKTTKSIQLVNNLNGIK